MHCPSAIVAAAFAVGLGATAAGAAVSDYQGAWVLSGHDCQDVYASAGKKASFKKPLDMFAPAFIISGRRLTTPAATCQIRSARPPGAVNSSTSTARTESRPTRSESCCRQRRRRA